MKKFISIILVISLFISLFGCEKKIMPSISVNEKINYEYKTGDAIKEVIPFIYEKADIFQGGPAPVKINGKCGYIDKNGNEAISFIYDDASFFHPYATIKLNNKYGVIDITGRQVIPCKYERINIHWDIVEVCLNGKYGYMNVNGKQVVPCKYDSVYDFFEGFSRVKKNEKYGFIGKNGNVVIPIKYDFAYDFNEGLACVALNHKYGFVDESGKTIIPFKYEYSRSYSDGLAAVALNGKWGYIDKNGNTVVSFKYDNVKDFKEGYAPVELNGKWGYIDINGNEVTQFKYDAAYSFWNGFAKVNINDKWGYIDKYGNEVISVKYEDVRHFSESLIAVKYKSKWGYIDKNGNTVVSFKYDNVKDFKEGYAPVELNGKWGYISYLSEKLNMNGYADGYYYENGNKIFNVWKDGRYFGEDGKMYVSKKTPDGQWVGENGYVVKDIKKDLMDSVLVKSIKSDAWYKTQSGLWYYFENDRTTTKKGWFTDNRDEQTYYFDPTTGIMAVGWTDIDGNMYYFNELNGTEPNWYEVGDGIYESYGKKVKAYGSMYRNEKTPDGKRVDKDGKLILN